MNALDRVDVRVGTTEDLGSVVALRRCDISPLFTDAVQLTYIEFQDFQPTDEEDEEDEEDDEKPTESEEVRYKCLIWLHY